MITNRKNDRFTEQQLESTKFSKTSSEAALIFSTTPFYSAFPLTGLIYQPTSSILLSTNYLTRRDKHNMCVQELQGGGGVSSVLRPPEESSAGAPLLDARYQSATATGGQVMCLVFSSKTRPLHGRQLR